MSKSRINKLIFQDGKIFLRVKTVARNLKLKKIESNYAVEFYPKNANGKPTEIPITFINEYSFPETLEKDALQLGLDKDDIDKLPNVGVSLKNYDWGKFVGWETPEDAPNNYYYLTPQKQKFSIKVGPIPTTLDSDDIELDWPNIQWGIESGS